MPFEWPYYILIEGKLYIKTRNGNLQAFNKVPRFASPNEAEAWLVEHDLRGKVRRPEMICGTEEEKPKLRLVSNTPWWEGQL